MPINKNQYNSVLFDLDGTLANTEILKARALAMSIHQLGKQIKPEAYKSVMGESWDVVTNHLFQIAGVRISLPSFNEIFREKYSELVKALLENESSTDQFLFYLKKNNFRIALVTSAAPRLADLVLQKLNMQKTFEVIITRDDTTLQKPHPEAYMLALERLGVRAEKALVFEDTEAGIISATTAGLKVFGRRHEYNLEHNFSLCEREFFKFDECLTWKEFQNSH